MTWRTTKRCIIHVRFTSMKKKRYGSFTLRVDANVNILNGVHTLFSLADSLSCHRHNIKFWRICKCMVWTIHNGPTLSPGVCISGQSRICSRYIALILFVIIPFMCLWLVDIERKLVPRQETNSSVNIVCVNAFSNSVWTWHNKRSRMLALYGKLQVVVLYSDRVSVFSFTIILLICNLNPIHLLMKCFCVYLVRMCIRNHDRGFSTFRWNYSSFFFEKNVIVI